MKKTSYLVLFGLLLGNGRGAFGAAHDNAAGFVALCNLYELAGQGAKLKEPVVENAVSSSVERVRKLDIILGANDSVYAEFKAREPEWTGQHPRPRDDGIRRRYAVALDLDFQKLSELEERAKLIRSGFKTIIEGIRGKLSKARFGGESKTVVTNKDVDAFGDTSTYATACGGTGAAPGPGKSLANDILCLCTTGGSSASESELCAKGISSVQTGWSTTLGAAQTNLDKIVKKCVKADDEPSPESIQAALAGFRKTLGAGAGMGSLGSTQEWQQYILGKGGAIESTGCDGTTGTIHVCVNYHHPIKNGGIPWENALREAVGLMRQLKAIETELVQLNRDASLINHEADKTFAEALHMDTLSKEEKSKTQNPELSPNEPTVASKKENLNAQTQGGYRVSYDVLLFGILVSQ